MKRTALVLIAGLASACTTGELAQTALSTPCAADDVTCQQRGDVDAPLAAGSVFALEVHPRIAGGTAVPVTLEAVDENVATVDDEGRVHAVAPGITAVLVLADDGSVLDFTHVAVAKADHLTFHRGGGADVDERALPDAIQVLPGEELTLSLRVWQAGQQLLGEMGDAWSVDDDAFRIVDQGFALERRVRAPDEGTAVITVDALGLSRSLTLEVIP